LDLPTKTPENVTFLGRLNGIIVRDMIMIMIMDCRVVLVPMYDRYGGVDESWVFECRERHGGGRKIFGLRQVANEKVRCKSKN
jgi:hypothetical protein